ncbi:MAG: hypothetical protein ACLPT6_07085 [Desulfobaccales bacterium]
MIQIDARSGLWTITHLIGCGASFQITGDKIVNAPTSIRCSNCGIAPDLASLRDAASYLIDCQAAIERASKKHDDPSAQGWQIDPPINLVEDVQPPKLVQVLR